MSAEARHSSGDGDDAMSDHSRRERDRVESFSPTAIQRKKQQLSTSPSGPAVAKGCLDRKRSSSMVAASSALKVPFGPGNSDGLFTLDTANQKPTSADHAPTIEYEIDETKPPAVFICRKNWIMTGLTLYYFPQSAKEQISENEFNILWRKAPLSLLRLLMYIWPEAYKGVDRLGANLIKRKCLQRKWDALKIIIEELPLTVTAEDIEYAILRGEIPPVDIFELMLDKRPNAPIELPMIVFVLIEKEKLDHFRILLTLCPGATKVKDNNLRLTPLLIILQKSSTINVDWIGAVLKANLGAARAKDYDGKYPLHLLYQHGACTTIIEKMHRAYPEAGNQRDNLGRTPAELAKNHEGSHSFTPLDQALVLTGTSEMNGSNSNMTDPNDNAVVLCRSNMLMRDIPLGGQESDGLQSKYAKQILARNNLFESLLHEFAEKVKIKDKDVIQKAATIQALAVKYLSRQNDTIIDFESFENPGYWFQQEMLKLVMKVYGTQLSSVLNPSADDDDDSEVCLRHLEQSKNGGHPPEPRVEHVMAFKELTEWIVDGLDCGSYSLQGPVLKTLQSLFNKIFIRRGQTSVFVIGDVVRATLMVNDENALQQIVERIETTFPHITRENFKSPDNFYRTVDFLRYVNDTLKFIPNSTNILPHRFKRNSSQKDKEAPTWFNLNFFYQVPEYYRVGQTEMFVEYELQIGLTSEVTNFRKKHDAYERDRILSNQPLLKNYEDSLLNGKREADAPSTLTDENKEVTCSEQDTKLIEDVLFGRIGSEVLILSPHEDNDDKNIMSFGSGPFSLSSIRHYDGNDFLKIRPKQLCINNRALNHHASEEAPNIFNKYALTVAGPYKLNENKKRYFVDSFIINGLTGVVVTVGLYAQVGPYLIQIASCRPNGKSAKDDVVEVVSSGRNFTLLEQVCPVPLNASSVTVIANGYLGNFSFKNMKLSLVGYDIQ